MKIIITTNRFPETKFKLGEKYEVADNIGRALVSQNEAREVREHVKTRNFPIGIRTREQILGAKDCASDRLRAEGIADNHKDIELYREDTEYDAIIFHHHDLAELDGFEGIKIMDLCDPIWIESDAVKEFIDRMDIIIVSTEGLKKEIKTDKPVYVVGDGHDTTKRIKKVHRKGNKKVVWFGYSENGHSLSPLMKTIKENGYKLKVISNDKSPHPLNKADEYVKWDVKTVDKEISKCDFAVLPVNGEFKSDNKKITAMLAGIPVAQNEKEFKALMSGKERNKVLKDFDFKPYDIKEKAKEYVNIVRSKQKV